MISRLKRIIAYSAVAALLLFAGSFSISRAAYLYYNADLGVAQFDSTISAPKVLGNTAAGTAGGYSFSGDGGYDTGMFSPSDGIVDFYTNAAQRMRIDTSGNIGIGTTAPGGKLDVQGGYSFFGGLRISGSDTGNTIWNGANNIVISADTGHLISLSQTSNSATGLTVNTTNGNVGIGTTAPGQKLHVAGGGYNFRLSNSANSYGYNMGRNTTDGLLYFYGDQASYTGYVFTGVGGEFMRIADTGNVGIGTASPSQKLEVSGDIALSSGGARYIRYGGGSVLIGNNNTGTTYLSSGSTDLQVLNNAFGGSPLLTIQNGGNVGIGTASPGVPLHVKGTGAEILRVESTGVNAYLDLVTSGGTAEISGQGGTILIGGAAAAPIYFRNNSYATRMLIDASGNVGIGTTAPGAQLEITGNMLMQNGTTFQAKNASAGVENWMWPRWTDNVMYTNFGSAGWNIRNNGSASVMYMTNGGNVGIGTTSPGSRLDVNGPGQAIAGTANGGTGTTNYGVIGQATSAASNNTGLYANATGATNNYGVRIVAPTAGSTSYAIYSDATAQSYFSGSVGIGATVPGAKLEIDGSTSQPVLSIGDSGIDNGAGYGMVNLTRPADSTKAHLAFIRLGNYVWQMGYASGTNTLGIFPWNLNSAGAPAMSFTTASNVGINTAAPGYKLDVQGGQVNASGGLCINGDCKTAWSQVGGSQWTTTGSNIYYNTGNVGIGTASPSYKLEVSGTIFGQSIAGNNLYITMPNGSTPAITNLIAFNPGYYMTYGGGGGGGLYYAASSRRYKTNIKPLEEDFEKILKTAPVSFNWKADPNKKHPRLDLGYIAEDFDALGLNRLVYYKNGKPDTIQYDKIALYDTEILKIHHQKLGFLEDSVSPAYILNGETKTLAAAVMPDTQEEATDVITLSRAGGTYQADIDLSAAATSSKLYIFAQTTDALSNIAGVKVLLTAGFDGRVWYKKQGAGKITVYAAPSDASATVLEVTYRMSAARNPVQHTLVP